MPFDLRDGVSFCIVNGRALFLDLVADRYFCASAHANRAFLALVAGDPGDSEMMAALKPLLNAGVLCRVDVHDLAPAQIEAAASMLVIGQSGSSWYGLMSAIALQLMTAAALRVRPLHRVLQAVEVRARKCRRHPTAELSVARRICCDFGRTSLILPVHDRCLLKAIALTRRLHRSGVSAKLIIGVRASPFTAHAWVQLGSAVLNDDLDHVRRFTPIHVVE